MGTRETRLNEHSIEQLRLDRDLFAAEMEKKAKDQLVKPEMAQNEGGKTELVGNPAKKFDLITNAQYQKQLESHELAKFHGEMLKDKFTKKYRTYRAGKERKIIIRDREFDDEDQEVQHNKQTNNHKWYRQEHAD